MKTKHLSLLAFIAAGICCGLVRGQDEEKAADQPNAKKAEITAITGGDIHTVTGEVIRGGTVLIEGGKIADVGQNVTVPDNANVIDATGKVITPGFVAISMTGVGIRGTPEQSAKLADSLDPFDRNIKFTLGAGITTGCVQLSAGGRRGRRGRDAQPEERFLGLEPDPQEFVTQAELDFGDEDTSVCPCCGLPILPTEPITPAPPTQATPRRHAVLKMSYGRLEPMLVKEHAFYDLAPGALAGALNRHNWRRDVREAKESLARREAAATRQADAQAGERSGRTRGRGRGGRGSRSSRGSSNEDLQRLVKKEVSLQIGRAHV